MRALPLALATLVLLGPVTVVFAQAPTPSVAVELAALDAPVVPLAEATTLNGTVVLSCALVVGAAPQAIALEVVEAPSWLQATPTPAEVFAAPDACDGLQARVPFTVLLTATAEAPAFVPEPMTVRAAVQHASGAYEGSGSTEVQAGYFSILDVVPAEPTRSAPAGDETSFAVVVRNQGNGATRVTFTATAPEGWDVRVPAPVLVEPGDEVETSLVVVPARGRGPEVVDVAYTSSYADDASLVGDSGAFQLLVTPERGLPAPGLLALVLLGLVAVALPRQRR